MDAAEILIDTFRLYAGKLASDSIANMGRLRPEEALNNFTKKLMDKCGCFERFAGGFGGCGEDYLLQLHQIAADAIDRFSGEMESG